MVDQYRVMIVAAFAAVVASLSPLWTVPARGAEPVAVVSSAASARPIEGYAAYDPATRCSPRPKPGAVRLQRYVVRAFGGHAGPISRSCGGSVSEHTEGRALDWTMNVHSPADRRAVQAFLRKIFATDGAGNEDALARRMGIMYVIWNDRMWASYRQFTPNRYLSSSCPSIKHCSDTLRHRDHVHISLSWPGARARTSWYR